MKSTDQEKIAAAMEARHQGTARLLERVHTTLQHMHRERARVTVAAVARRADVSRTFLHQNEQAKALVAGAAKQADAQRSALRTKRAEQQDASWRERALNAEEAVKTCHGEIRLQRTRIAVLLGRVQDLEADLPSDAVQKLVTENTTLKQTVWQLSQDKGRLEDRLKGARENNRFLDKRLAELEATIADEMTSRLSTHASAPLSVT
ncbi:DUF6262 family protein [Streptomyces platensis]|uniref:DUF6262 family protein n=1 Tax=Streptomyces platensis TaxID=58346 RepID=UPI0022512597|nr:DUF6262 family protein [Streptomyces platensis]MCX4637152.1 DUF6262 family protein [Streptomyces platensis]